MLDRESFGRTLLGLAEALQVSLSTPALGIYYAVLRDLDDDAWKRALERAARECLRHQMPTPAELRQLGGEHSAEDRVIAAWTEATRAASSIGRWRSVDFEDQAINAAIRSMGGWSRFCGLDTEELERFGRKDFERAYRGFAKSIPAEYAAHLPGIAEQANGGEGKAIAPPVRVAATTALPAPPRVLGAGSPLRALLAGGSR